MKTVRYTLGALAGLGLLWTSGAMAATVQVIGAPSSVSHGALESGNIVHLFEEQTGVSYSGPVDLGSVAPGQLVNSYTLHADKVNDTPGSGIRTYNASYTFVNPILAIIFRTPKLINSDSALGASGTTYVSNTGAPWRGAEVGGGAADSISYLGNTVTFSLHVAPNGMDEFRVLTAVPIPAALPLLGSALGMLGLFGYRRKKQSAA